MWVKTAIVIGTLFGWAIGVTTQLYLAVSLIACIVKPISGDCGQDYTSFLVENLFCQKEK